MKISVDDKTLFELSNTQKKVICNDLHADEFDLDMKRRLEWVLLHKYESCFKRLKEKWDKILAERYDSIPSNADKYAELVFSQPDYQGRKEREASLKL